MMEKKELSPLARQLMNNAGVMALYTQKEFDEATRAVDMQIKGVELGLKMGEKMTQQPKGE